MIFKIQWFSAPGDLDPPFFTMALKLPSISNPSSPRIYQGDDHDTHKITQNKYDDNKNMIMMMIMIMMMMTTWSEPAWSCQTSRQRWAPPPWSSPRCPALSGRCSWPSRGRTWGHSRAGGWSRPAPSSWTLSSSPGHRLWGSYKLWKSLGKSSKKGSHLSDKNHYFGLCLVLWFKTFYVKLLPDEGLQ